MMIGISIILIAIIFFGDLWLKNKVERTLAVGETRERLGGRLLIRRLHNKGAVMHLGQNRSKMVAVLGTILTLAAFAIFCISLGQKGNRLLQIGMAIMLGGAFSNTYDRLKRKYVVDYFSFGVKWKALRRIVFNLSDFCIIIGALIAVIGAQK